MVRQLVALALTTSGLCIPGAPRFKYTHDPHTLGPCLVLDGSIIAASDEARAVILARIREACGRTTDAAQSAAEEYIGDRPRGPLPPVERDVVARFRARAESMQATTDLVRCMAHAPAAVAAFLQSHALGMSGCVSPQLADFDWSGAHLDLRVGAALPNDAVGITGAYAAIAETGTLMLLSSPATPASTSLLPETHVAVVPVERIVPYMEDAWDLVRTELGELPRAVNFVSGPSRTADIDQQIVLGAHGPYRVHIILIQQ